MFDGNLFFLFRNITIFFAGVMLVKYFVFLILSPFHPVKEALRKYRLQQIRSAKNHKKYQPSVSIITPAWNEEVGILRTVRSVLNNSYPLVEMIVVNDGSEDKTDRVMKDFLASDEYKKIIEASPSKKLHYFRKKNGGKGTALNHAIVRATGELIVTVDADSVVDSQAIEKLVTYFEDPKIDAAVGQVRIDNNPGLIGTMQKLEYAFGFYHKRAHSVLGAEYVFGGACAAFRKENTFEKFGLFDEINRTEDIEMSMRCRYFGKHAVYAEDVVCYTEGPSDITGLVNQRLRWKKGRLDTFIKYRSMFFSRKNHHNRALAWFILPYSLASELQLFFEPIGFTLLATYSVLTGDYLSIAIGILFIFLMYLAVGLFNHERVNLKMMLLFPFTWPLFYLLVWVEYIVLLRSLVMILRGEEIVWQRWNRKGVRV